MAARTKDQALAAAAEVRVTYEPLPVMLSPDEALAGSAVQIHPDRPNLCFRQPQIKGDAETALASSHVMVEADFSTQIVHQAPLEPENCVAWFEGDDDDPQMVVAGRSINIHHAFHTLQDAVGWENMRYEEAFSGGQFGLRADISSDGIAAAAAAHFRRPVRYTPSLTDSMLMSSKRHAIAMKVRMGADADGRITAYANDFTVDNGAYYSIGSMIIVRALSMLSGSYLIPHIKAETRLVYTQ